MTCKTIGEASPWASSCPSFAPVPAETRQLGKARSGERDRSTCISPHWQERARDSSADRHELRLPMRGSLHGPLRGPVIDPRCPCGSVDRRTIAV
jgi:hypothetical protein